MSCQQWWYRKSLLRRLLIMSEKSNPKQEETVISEIKNVKTKESEPSEFEKSNCLEERTNAKNALQSSLGEFLVLELREAIKEATKKIVQNDQRVEELEEKIRNYEDHIDCLEQLVKELQSLLRSTFEAQDKALPTNLPSISPVISNISKAEEVSPPLIEVSLDDPPEKQILTKKTTIQTKLLNISFLSRDQKRVSSTKRKIEPSTNKEELRVDIEEGTLNDFI